jgi:putative serine protease PepD
MVYLRTLLNLNRIFIFGILTFMGFFAVSSISFSQRNRAQKVYDKVDGAIFSVLTYHKDGSRHAQGSGVVLKSKGWLVTNFHVMGDAKTFKASHYGKKLKLDTLVRADKKNDILIIAIDKSWDPDFYEQIPDIKVADILKVQIGQDIYAIGSPLGYENTITNGIVSGIRPSSDSLRQFIQISAPFSPARAEEPW